MLGIDFYNFQRICFCVSLVLLTACESNKMSEEGVKTVTLYLSDLMFEESNAENIAETEADFMWKELTNGDWHFTIEFIAKEGSSVITEGKLFKNMPITIYYILPIDEVRTKSGHKTGIKPFKHQKIKIKYLKNEPGLIYNKLESIKCRDEKIP